MPTDRDDNVKLIPLGGCGEIGMNCLAVESAGKVLLVDCGVMFPSPEQPGIQMVHPAFDYLVSRRDDLVGLVLTHGHEDHIAAVPYLLREVDVPVYGAPYTIGLVRSRMKEFDHAGKLDAGVLSTGSEVQLGPFSVEGFPVPHSIVHNLGFIIRAGEKRILHTGDFKLADRNPEDLIEDGATGFANAGPVDLLLCDSTGAEEREPSGEEALVEETMASIAASTPGRLYVAIFASNVRRLESIASVAKNSGRKLFMSGRSVLNHVKVAGEVGVLRLSQDLLGPIERIDEHPRARTLVILSGTQGEDRSALGRLSLDNHKGLNVREGDTVVLSSRFIPGNELAIARTIDRLLKLGATVKHRDNHPGVHVSGHGSIGEIEKVVRAVNPRAFMPVHGTHRHLLACAEIAGAKGVEQVAVASNGQAVVLDSDGIRATGEEIPTRKILIDGGFGVSDSTMRDRRLLGAKGILFLSWIPREDGMPEGPVNVVMKGVVSEEAVDWTADQVRQAVLEKLRAMEPSERGDEITCRETVRSALRKFMSKSIGREPFVHVSTLTSNR